VALPVASPVVGCADSASVDPIRRTGCCMLYLKIDAFGISHIAR
jgi:hypothetical protein